MCAGRRRGSWLVLAAWACVAGFAQAQSPSPSPSSQADLERRRASLSERIEETSRLLGESRQTREAGLDRLVGLRREVEQRRELVALLKLQIAHADSSAARTSAVTASLEADIDTLVADYGRVARAALRQNLLQSRLSFLLSAEGVADAVRRVRYLQRYDAHRRRQVTVIRETRDALAGKVDRLTDVRAEKERLLAEARLQEGRIAQALERQEDLVADLKRDEATLKRDLARQRSERKLLDASIAGVIARADRAAARARGEAGAGGAPASAKTEDDVAPARVRSDDYAAAGLASDFRRNRGRLPWPVARGYVSKPYGTRTHPTMPKVKINNNGVDIRTDRGAAVRAVFEGQVVGLQQVPGYHTMVILRHGEYYSVYSNLVDVAVKPGARVGTADVLGAVAVDADTDVSELHFEVWRGRETQDPGRWVGEM